MEVESTHHQVKWISKLQTVAIHQVGKFQGPALAQRNIPKDDSEAYLMVSEASNKVSQRKRESLWVDTSELK